MPSDTFPLLSHTTRCYGFIGHSAKARKFHVERSPMLYALIESKEMPTNKRIKQPNQRLFTKTSESFKLSDLFLLESTIQAKLFGFDCQSVAFDHRTGSHLLSWKNVPILPNVQEVHPNADNDLSMNNLDFQYLSSLFRSQWIAEELANGTTAIDFIHEIKKHQENGVFICNNWSLDYYLFGSISSQLSLETQETPKHTQKSLSFRVAQSLQTDAALDPKKAENKLIIIETSSEFLLVKVLSQDEFFMRLNGASNKNTKIENSSYSGIWTKWKGRPFQYSSATNPVVADLVVDLLLSIVYSNFRKNDLSTTFSKSNITLLDPCCGCGTFLISALSKQMKAYGIDCNEKCIEGTLQNMQFMFEEKIYDDSKKWIKTIVGDSSQSIILRDTTTKGKHFQIDAVAANLPWGLNSIEYLNENTKIMRSLKHDLNDCTPLVFISKNDITDDLQKLGFKVLGHASIPPNNFELQTSRKNKIIKLAGSKPSKRKHTSSDCVITIAKS